MNRLLNLFTVAAVVALGAFGFTETANAAAGAWSCSKVFNNQNNTNTPSANNPATNRQDFYYRYVFDNAGVSSTTYTAVLGAGQAVNGCGDHVFDLTSAAYATLSSKGGTSGGAAGLGITITASRDLSATGAFPTTVSFTALTGTVSNTFVSGTLPAANMLQVTVSNSAVGNANQARVVIDEFPNSQTK